MEKNWVNDIIDDAVKEVNKWPSWMQEGQVRVSEETPDSTEKSISTTKVQKPASD